MKKFLSVLASIALMVSFSYFISEAIENQVNEEGKKEIIIFQPIENSKEYKLNKDLNFGLKEDSSKKNLPEPCYVVLRDSEDKKVKILAIKN